MLIHLHRHFLSSCIVGCFPNLHPFFLFFFFLFFLFLSFLFFFAPLVDPCLLFVYCSLRPRWWIRSGIFRSFFWSRENDGAWTMSWLPVFHFCSYCKTPGRHELVHALSRCIFFWSGRYTCATWLSQTTCSSPPRSSFLPPTLSPHFFFNHVAIQKPVQCQVSFSLFSSLFLPFVALQLIFLFADFPFASLWSGEPERSWMRHGKREPRRRFVGLTRFSFDREVELSAEGPRM